MDTHPHRICCWCQFCFQCRLFVFYFWCKSWWCGLWTCSHSTTGHCVMCCKIYSVYLWPGHSGHLFAAFTVQDRDAHIVYPFPSNPPTPCRAGGSSPRTSSTFGTTWNTFLIRTATESIFLSAGTFPVYDNICWKRHTANIFSTDNRHGTSIHLQQTWV